MTTSTAADLSLTRVFDAPRDLVFRAFVEPDQFAAWWGPHGNFLPREQLEFDVRPGGHISWAEFFPEDEDVWTHGSIDITEVVEGELLDGMMRINGQLPPPHKPFETRMRLEFYDEADGRTRLEVMQWLPERVVAGTRNGWAEAFSKLGAMLAA